MAKNALEIHVLDVADADCILVTRWIEGAATRTLIDGGNESSVGKTKDALKELGATRLDHVICSHIDDDHAAGLAAIVEDDSFDIGQGYMHIVTKHHTLLEMKKAEEEAKREGFLKEARMVTASVQTYQRLHQAFLARDKGKEPLEPFAGMQIGEMLVCGPDEPYYKDQISRVKNIHILEGMRKEASAAAADNDPERPLLINPKETPTNNTSVVLLLDCLKEKMLFTGDAGAGAQVRASLYAAKAGRSCANLDWFKVPHHGSRKSITQGLIDFYKPKVSYISASGNGHPDKSVVGALKKHGQVYATFHPKPGDLSRRIGDAPDRPIVPATPL